MSGWSIQRIVWGRTRAESAALADAEAKARESRSHPHPEDYCHRCGGGNLSWFVSNDVWNAVMRPEGPSSPWLWDEIICPPCFAELAGGGIWELVPRGGSASSE